MIDMQCTEGSTNTWNNAVASQCVIGGKFTVALAVNSNASETPVLDATTGEAFVAMGVNEACAFVFGVNAAGTLVASQGPITPCEVGITTTVGAFKLAPAFPSLPDDFCPIAYTLVRTAPDASAWTFGTDNWTSTGVTVSDFIDVSELPSQPQTS
ncbi:MAG: hypothetical protein NUW01_05290 [Gemmatimonadaceae bacterium]|nr:hypothetical protein [Gemmatimonadaceae bacterium]